MKTKIKDFGSIMVDGINSISESKINFALGKQEVQFKKAIEETKLEAEKIAKEAVKEEIEAAKKDMFIMFGIFASFITFIVGEINILKTIDSIYDKVGFSFLFICFIQGFLFGIIFLFDDQKFESKFSRMKNVFKWFFTLGLAFLIVPNFFK